MPSGLSNPIRSTGTVIVFLFVIAAAGCSTVSETPSTSAEDSVRSCERFFQTLDAVVDKAGVRDGGAARIDGFPYLRANRFLASFRFEPMTAPQERSWIDLLQELDSEARAFELANLSAQARAGLDLKVLANTEDLSKRVARCAKALVQSDLSDAESIAGLRDAIEVPDDYHAWKRVVGLYPLTALPFKQGVLAFHADREAVFATPLDALPVEGQLVSYTPPPGPVEGNEDLSAILARARRNPLQVPLPTPYELSHLFSTYAPVLEIDQVDRNDRIGMPMMRADGEPDVNVSDPVVFVRAAHTRFGDETLLQLVYSFWFPERPRMSTPDLLAGRLDGITWRVTLDSEGKPLLFDSMHNCGCYHTFFPTEKLRAREVEPSLEEPMLIGSRLSAWRPSERIVLRIAPRTHYIQNVRLEPASVNATQQLYTFRPDNQLRSLHSEDLSRYSLFRPDGIVPGTQRGERFFFWPMGVPDPGAMRQWGRHATAFVGRRHFDDPNLIERYFDLL